MPRESYAQNARPVAQGFNSNAPPQTTVSRRNLLKVAIAAALIAFSLLMVYLMLQSQSMANAKRLDKLDNDLRETRNLRDDLAVKLMQSENIMLVEKEAKERLGMKPIKPSQIKEVDVALPEKEAAEIPAPEEKNWLQRLLSSWW